MLGGRFGYRRIMLAGALAPVAGQTLPAFAGSLAPALAARTLVGLGDGVMFVSMVRLIAGWFGADRGRHRRGGEQQPAERERVYKVG